MLPRTPVFLMLSAAGLVLCVGGAWLVHLFMPGAKEPVLATILAGFFLTAAGAAPLFTRAFFEMAPRRGPLAAALATPEGRRNLADIFALLIWAVWIAGGLVALPVAWPEMLTSMEPPAGAH